MYWPPINQYMLIKYHRCAPPSLVMHLHKTRSTKLTVVEIPAYHKVPDALSIPTCSNHAASMRLQPKSQASRGGFERPKPGMALTCSAAHVREHASTTRPARADPSKAPTVTDTWICPARTTATLCSLTLYKLLLVMQSV